MNPIEIIDFCRNKGIELRPEGDHLRFNAPIGALTAELRQMLTSNKQAILKHLQERHADSVTDGARLQPNLARHPIPLSFAQQRLWFLAQWEPKSTAYLQAYAWRLHGALDSVAFESALNALAVRQDSLRVGFSLLDDQPIQVIERPRDISIPLCDLTTLSECSRENQLQNLIQQDTHQWVDLARGPLWRAQLIRLRSDMHIFLFTIHHIITDGWSMGIIWKELEALYAAHRTGQPANLPSLLLQYADFAVWQRRWLQGEVLDRQLAYWCTQLAGAPSSLELPTDFPRPPQQTYRGNSITFVIPASLTQALKTLSHQENVTLFMTLLAAFQLLLFRHTGQRDILVGAPMAGRTHTDLENLIGFFVNTLILRTQFTAQSTFRDILRQVRQICLEAYAHQDLPFEKLVETLQPVRDLSRHPVVQVMFQLFGRPVPTFSLQEMHITPEPIPRQSVKFDLNCILRESNGLLRGTMEYRTDLFGLDTIQRLVRHYQHLLEGIIGNPDRQVTTLPILSHTERQQLFIEWNDTARDYPDSTSLHQLFEIQVESTPDAMAVVCEDQQLTYRELNRRANQLAHFLQEQGVGPEVRVGLCLERNIDMIVGLLGILKAGGAYIPLDPTYPEERLHYIVKDSNPEFLVTQDGLLQGLNASELPRLSLDRDRASLARFPVDNPDAFHTAQNLAYLIYTSGSTGQPKGVMITHGAVVNLLLSQQEYVTLDPTDIVLAVSSLSFDISVFELLGPLLVGSCLVLIGREAAMDGAELLKILHSHGITVMQATPTMWHMLLQADHSHLLGSLKIISAGEPMTADLAHRLQPWGSAIWNAYGPTEATIWSTIYEVQSPEDQIPIGRPLANTSIALLDRSGEPVPIGVMGEILIGGNGVARGYHRRPDLTAEKFIPQSLNSRPGARMYRTGDLGRYRANGNIEYLGRFDHQVKVRGHRIELGEIEAVLGTHPDISQAVMLCREDSPGVTQLVAYVVVEHSTRITPTDLLTWLKDSLPDYMLPSMFVFLPALPLTPNGKVDRRALPIPDPTQQTAGLPFVSARTPLEELIAEVWRDVLKVKQLGMDDNFFVLGGHSLLATRVIARLRQTLNIDLSLRLLFEQPTVAQLATGINKLLDQIDQDEDTR
ncbi:MAG: amino acid adenylation domain-containing protein [Nitrospirales bacterium]